MFIVQVIGQHDETKATYLAVLDYVGTKLQTNGFKIYEPQACLNDRFLLDKVCLLIMIFLIKVKNGKKVGKHRTFRDHELLQGVDLLFQS